MSECMLIVKTSGIRMKYWRVLVLTHENDYNDNRRNFLIKSFFFDRFKVQAIIKWNIIQKENIFRAKGKLCRLAFQCNIVTPENFFGEKKNVFFKDPNYHYYGFYRAWSPTATSHIVRQAVLSQNDSLQSGTPSWPSFFNTFSSHPSRGLAQGLGLVGLSDVYTESAAPELHIPPTWA